MATTIGMAPNIFWFLIVWRHTTSLRGYLVQVSCAATDSLCLQCMQRKVVHVTLHNPHS
jgi:hypothetical protein